VRCWPFSIESERGLWGRPQVKRGNLLSYLEGVDAKTLPRTPRQNQAIQHSEVGLQVLASHMAAAIGLRQVENRTRSGQVAVDRFDRLAEVMAESRLLEFEFTSGMIGMMFSPDQSARMQRHVESLKCILEERSSQQGAPADADEPRR